LGQKLPATRLQKPFPVAMGAFRDIFAALRGRVIRACAESAPAGGVSAADMGLRIVRFAAASGLV
jgi:hypothetical protein